MTLPPQRTAELRHEGLVRVRLPQLTKVLPDARLVEVVVVHVDEGGEVLRCLAHVVQLHQILQHKGAQRSTR